MKASNGPSRDGPMDVWVDGELHPIGLGLAAVLLDGAVRDFLWTRRVGGDVKRELEFLHDLLHEGLGGPRGHLVGAGRPAGSLQAAGTVAAALHWQGRAGLPAGPACQPKQMHATACPAGVPRLL